jgi:hypothetical protein
MGKISPGNYIDALPLHRFVPHPIHGTVTYGLGYEPHALSWLDGCFPRTKPARLRRSYWRLKRLQRGECSTFTTHMFKHEI